MIDEMVDTSSNFDAKKIPNGPHKCRVLRVRKSEKGGLYIWELSYDGGKEGEIAMFGNLMGPLLEALGCAKQPDGKYHLSSQIVDGASFDAEFYEEADKSDSSKLYKRMKNIKGEGIPY
jgi:hypothetical protein